MIILAAKGGMIIVIILTFWHVYDIWIDISNSFLKFTNMFWKDALKLLKMKLNKLNI